MTKTYIIFGYRKLNNSQSRLVEKKNVRYKDR